MGPQRARVLFFLVVLALLPEEDIVAFEEQKDRWLIAPTKSSP